MSLVSWALTSPVGSKECSRLLMTWQSRRSECHQSLAGVVEGTPSFSKAIWTESRSASLAAFLLVRLKAPAPHSRVMKQLNGTCLLPDILNCALGGSSHLPAIFPCLCRHLHGRFDEWGPGRHVKQCSRCSSSAV